MIKRVIFDIDNTLIPWKEEYYNEINEVLDSLNIKHTQEDYNKSLSIQHLMPLLYLFQNCHQS